MSSTRSGPGSRRPGGRAAVLELVGLAGVGKTTLTRALAAGEPGLRVGLPLSRGASARAQAAATLPFVLPWWREARGTRWFSRDQVRGLGYLRAWQRRCDAAQEPGGRVVLDHGPLFWLACLDALGPPLVATSGFRTWWETAVDGWATRLTLVVLLEAPAEVLLARVHGRAQRHLLLDMDAAASQEFLARYRASYDRVLARVLDRAPDRVLELRTDLAGPEELATAVRQRLQRMGSGEGVSPS